MAKPPSTVDRAIDVLRRASGPMTFAELLGAISAEGPISTKNPSNTLRSALGNTSLIVSTGEGQYEYVPRGTTGCIFRQPLRMEEAAEGVIAWERDVAIAIWPAANEHGPTRQYAGPVRFRLDAADEIALDYEWLAPHRFGSKNAAPLWAWLHGQNASTGDELVVQTVDGPARIVQLTFSPRDRRDEEAIRARNVELADTVEPIVARRPTKSLYFRDTVAELMVRGSTIALALLIRSTTCWPLTNALVWTAWSSAYPTAFPPSRGNHDGSWTGSPWTCHLFWRAPVRPAPKRRPARNGSAVAEGRARRSLPESTSSR